MSHVPGHHDNPTVSFFDRDNTSLGELVGWVDLSSSWKWNKPSTAVVVVPEIPDMWVDLAKCRTQTVLAAIDHRLHWSGQVTDVEVKINRDRGQRTTEITMVDDWAILHTLLARQNPLGELANQAAAEFDVREGPAETVVKSLLADVAQRMGLPMVIAPPSVPDTSPVVRVDARMDPLDKILPPLLEAASLRLTIHLHRQGGTIPDSLADTGDAAIGQWVVDVQSSRNDDFLAWDETELVDGTLTLSAPLATRLIVGGAGEGVEKVYGEVVNADLDASMGPYRVRETYVDDADGTKTAQAVSDMLGRVSVAFSVDDGVPWTAGEDFQVGDFGGGTIGGVDFRARIEEIELTADETGTARYVPKIGESIPPPEVQVARAVARIADDLATERRRK